MVFLTDDGTAGMEAYFHIAFLCCRKWPWYWWYEELSGEAEQDGEGYGTVNRLCGNAGECQGFLRFHA